LQRCQKVKFITFANWELGVTTIIELIMDEQRVSSKMLDYFHNEEPIMKFHSLVHSFLQLTQSPSAKKSRTSENNPRSSKNPWKPLNFL
jgi:hypothetical protein